MRALHREIRAGVRESCAQSALTALAHVAEDGPGDTLYAIDKVSEARLVAGLSRDAERLGGIVLIAEGVSGGFLTLPEGRDEARCRYRVIVDPIDGTRPIMYQKRSAWILTGVAENKGAETRLSDIELAVQSELPVMKQELADDLWAVRGQGAAAERVDLRTGDAHPLRLTPSRASNIEHGFSSVVRLFPGVRDELAAIDDELVERLIGPPVAGKVRCFEDQYASTGGQLYELIAGHDRFLADLRPRLKGLLGARGLPVPLCCHPYDICTALIAEELGVLIRNPEGGALDCALNLEEDVAWVGYANQSLLERIEPVLISILERRGYLELPGV